MLNTIKIIIIQKNITIEDKNYNKQKIKKYSKQ